MPQTSLVILAAGIGSRYGDGIKQLEKVGPDGEIIMDYSIYDAVEAGFDKVIFVIRKDLDREFREVIGDRISKYVPVEYAYQQLSDIPAGFSVPADRRKPWGTGQALLSARDLIDGPFLVINSDDYYGKEGFRILHDYMIENMTDDSGVMEMCMAGFILANTLSEHGGVTRGVCTVNDSGYLTGVTETYDIRMEDGKVHACDIRGNAVPVEAGQYASMNMFGFPKNFLGELQKDFPKFLSGLGGNDTKAEYLLPAVVDRCIQEGLARVRVLETRDRWFGVTYREDKPEVVTAFRQLTDDGVYPKKLFE